MPTGLSRSEFERLRRSGVPDEYPKPTQAVVQELQERGYAVDVTVLNYLVKTGRVHPSRIGQRNFSWLPDQIDAVAEVLEEQQSFQPAVVAARSFGFLYSAYLDALRQAVQQLRVESGDPAIAEAAVAGTLSASQLRELEKCNRPKYRDLLRLMQHDLVNELARLNAAETAVACDTWRRYADALVDEHAPPAEPDRMFVTTRADDGQLLGTLSLDDAAATELEKALSNALTHEGPGDTRSTARRQADALFDICAFFNLNHEAEGTPRHHPHVSLSLHANTLAAPVATNVDTGRPVAQHTANAALCDCIIHTILRDATNAPTGFGRQRYTVSKKLFKEVAARDGGCRVRGCNRLPKWCHAHHIAWWNRDHGPTDYDNLVLLCSRHHHMVHQFDLRLQWVNGWNLQITWPDGRCTVSSPRGAPPSAPPGRSFPTAA